MDRYGDMIRIVERRGRTRKGGVIEFPRSRNILQLAFRYFYVNGKFN
jgi:hypothetical protein